MRPFRFLHAADLHLDSPFRGLQSLPETVRERVRQSTFAALSRLVRLAVSERVDFVVIAGDVYDAADRSLRAQIRFRQAMEQLAEAGIPALIVHGNHDPDDGRAAKLNWPHSVRFFSSREVECVPVKAGDGTVLAHVYGISFGSASVTENLAARFSVKSGAPYHLALLHANVDGDASYDNYAPCTLQELMRSGFDYWALGHIHDRRVLGSSPPVVYAGNVQGRSVKEPGAKGCCVVNVDEEGRSALHFFPLDDVRWFKEECSTLGLETEEQLLAAIRECMEKARALADGRAVMLRLVLTGRSFLHNRLRRSRLADELADVLREEEERLASASLQAPFVWLESIVVETGSTIDRAALIGEMSFTGELLRLSEALMADEAGQKAFAMEALEPLQGHALLRRLVQEIGPDELREWLAQAEALVLDYFVQEPD